MTEIKGDDIRALRKKWNLTRKRLAEILGCDETTIIHWEDDTNKVKVMDEIMELLISKGDMK
jgi:DNA-binding transcriptional regulator YiaG